MKRRDFFAVLGGGIVVLLVDDSDAQEAGGGARRGTNEPAPKALSAWLHIGETGLVTVYTGKVEVGQNARTALTQAAAEELRAPVESIRMVMGDTALTPFDMGTFGSMTTPRMNPQIRKAAATAREMLIDLASQKWMVERSAITIVNGKLTAGSRSAGFGEFTGGQKLTRTIPASAALTPASEWKISGTSVPKVNGREIVTGAHQYAYDIRRPEMQYGKILHPPSYGATLVSLDGSEAEKLPGVKVVHDGDFAGVAAPDPQTAEKAVAALKAEWKQLTAETSSKEMYGYFRRTAQNAPAANPALTTYTIAYIAHVPLEPRAAVAEWNDGKLTVWTGTQRPFGVRSELSQQFGIPEDQVHVLMPDTGSGYGGKHTGDAAVEAARLAKAVGKPVKRNWTREEEMTWAYFRPGGVIDVGARVNADGIIEEWEFHNYNSGPSGLQSPYDDRRPEGAISPFQDASATEFLPWAGGHGQSLRARVLHGRAGARGQAGSPGVPAEECSGRAAARGDPGGGRQIRLAGADEDRGPRIRHWGGLRKGRLRGHLRRGRGDQRSGEGGAGYGVVRMRGDRQSGAPVEPGGRGGGHGNRRRAVRADRICRQSYPEPAAVALPGAALRGYAEDRLRAGGPQGHHFRGGRRDADCGDRAGDRQRHLRCHRAACSLAAAGAEGLAEFVRAAPVAPALLPPV